MICPRNHPEDPLHDSVCNNLTYYKSDFSVCRLLKELNISLHKAEQFVGYKVNRDQEMGAFNMLVDIQM